MQGVTAEDQSLLKKVTFPQEDSAADVEHYVQDSSQDANWAMEVVSEHVRFLLNLGTRFWRWLIGAGDEWRRRLVPVPLGPLRASYFLPHVTLQVITSRACLEDAL